jgi:hypothetical protein
MSERNGSSVRPTCRRAVIGRRSSTLGTATFIVYRRRSTTVAASSAEWSCSRPGGRGKGLRRHRAHPNARRRRSGGVRPIAASNAVKRCRGPRSARGLRSQRGARCASHRVLAWRQARPEEDVMESVGLLDRAGRRRSQATLSGFHQGRVPRNRGLRYPPDPPPVEEIVAVMRVAARPPWWPSPTSVRAMCGAPVRRAQAAQLGCRARLTGSRCS